MQQGLRNELALIAAAAGIASLGLKQKKTALGLGLAAAALRFLPPVPGSEPYSFRNKVAVITGGSRGFGLAIAEELVQKGAKVFLLARDGSELERAAAKIRWRQGVDVGTIAVDVTHSDELLLAFRRVYQQTGRIDVLVNNAGAITVGPFSSMDQKDFQAQLDLHLHAIASATRLAIPFFRRLGGGRILNISSLGGKIPFPHMSPYAASKFALGGFSASVAAELREHGIQITTAYPGLMRTGSPAQAQFKGIQEKEFGWFLFGDVMPGLSMEADVAAKEVLRAFADGRSEVVVSLPAKLGVFMAQNFPEIFSFFASIAARRLPHGNSYGAKAGAESRGWLASHWWGRALLRRNESFERRWNQHVGDRENIAAR